MQLSLCKIIQLKRIYLFYSTFFVVLLSCSTPKGFEYKGLNNVKIKNLGFEYVDLSLNLVCYNPNNFKLDLKKVDCEVYIDNRYLGNYALDTLMHIPKKQNFELPSQMRVSMGGVFKNAFSLLMNKEVLIKVKGKTKIGKGSIFFDVPFTYESRQAISL
jgi:LEA14-like dessication related protein